MSEGSIPNWMKSGPASCPGCTDLKSELSDARKDIRRLIKTDDCPECVELRKRAQVASDSYQVLERLYNMRRAELFAARHLAEAVRLWLRQSPEGLASFTGSLISAALLGYDEVASK